ncbi:MAG: type III-B CRISPR module-associated protein Cmr5 [Thermoguttaceae bacterium]|jgi:CRISPR-associated protein Cmr5|nr:type III-B CRISPR module-associated protein Cmr5 [Thermoguttaceae bacterium]
MKTQTSAHQTLDQRRAAHAWNAVDQLNRFTKPEQDEYAGHAKKLPIRIMSSGLGQGLVFLLAKAKDNKPHVRQLHGDLTDWTLGHRGLPGPMPGSLLHSVIHPESDSDFLRQATDEVLAYLQWLNRFIEAEGIKADDENQAAP